MNNFELTSEEVLLEQARKFEKLVEEPGAMYMVPFESYQRKNIKIINDNFQTIGRLNEGYIPICASNELYLEELKKLMYDRFMVD